MSVTTNDQALQETLKSIRWLISEFQREPYHFLYESDLQAALMCDMRSRINTTIAVRRSAPSQPPYRLNLVSSEYSGVPSGKGVHIDVACIDIALAQKYPLKAPDDTDIYIYQLPVSVGVELKYCKMGDRPLRSDWSFDACVADFTKLERLKLPHGIVLGFVQDDGVADTFLKGAPKDWICSSKSGEPKAGAIVIISPERVLTYAKLG